jgi:hypothetical protein
MSGAGRERGAGARGIRAAQLLPALPPWSSLSDPGKWSCRRRRSWPPGTSAPDFSRALRPPPSCRDPLRLSLARRRSRKTRRPNFPARVPRAGLLALSNFVSLSARVSPTPAVLLVPRPGLSFPCCRFPPLIRPFLSCHLLFPAPQFLPRPHLHFPTLFPTPNPGPGHLPPFGHCPWVSDLLCGTVQPSDSALGTGLDKG